MRHLDVKQKLSELVGQAPDWETIRRIGDLSKLRARPDGSFFRPNYESGLLLYALVARFRPRRILEIGTGRGFSSLCMALALRERGLDGEILTIDVQGYADPQEWALDDGTGPRLARLSLREVWERHFDADLRARISTRRGSSMDVLGRLRADGDFRPDLVYVDGDHGWTVVRHDFYAALLLARRPFRILLDDYEPRSDLYGVRRLVDEELEPRFELEAIYTDGRWHGGPHEHAPLEVADSAQVLLDSEGTRVPPERALDQARAARIVRRHRRWRRAIDFAQAARAGLRRRLRG